ncbi:MAG TPA: DnaJ domain-containing protein [Pyrinomonadaceae bacterium]|jgi:curved DNA-binding protein CbpA
MNGQLSEHPLAELISEIAATGLSGSLRLTRDRVKVAVYFEEGGIVYAASNLRPHRLSECARRWNVEAVQRLAAARENISDMELGLALVAGGDLSRAEFEELLARQAVEVLRPALLWTTGGWDFDPRVRLTIEVQSRVEVKELLMETARRLPPDFIATRFKAEEEKLVPTGSLANGLQLLPVEGFVLSRVDAPILLSELTAISAIPEAETLQALYALVLGGFLSRSGAQQAFTAEQAAKARAVKPPTARVVPAPGMTLSKFTSPAQQAAETQAAPAKTEHQQNDVEILFARLDDAENYYQVLDLSRDAEASEIKRAYHGLAKRFHPDRFHKDTDPTVYARVEDAFARISQAYETLKDQQMRAAYDRSLAQSSKAGPPKSSPPPPTPKQEPQRPAAKTATQTSAAPPSMPWAKQSPGASKPEAIHQQGIAALQQGNLTLALSFLGEAARLQPKMARYRAQYGRALAAGAQTGHQAEAEFKAAIELDKNNVYYRVMLARLYAEMNMLRRAQSELERALAIDPQSESARLLLDKLKGKG